MSQGEEWLRLPDHVATLLGRFAYYAAHLDDVLGEAVVLGHLNATELAESTPDWATSGTRLIAAVRGIQVSHPFIDDLADLLVPLNEARNLLIHGAWLWEDDHVLVLKRALGKGQRAFSYASLSYSEIEGYVAQYQRLGHLVDRLVKLLLAAQPNGGRERWDGPPCPTDAAPMQGAVVGGVIVWQCPTCHSTADAGVLD